MYVYMYACMCVCKANPMEAWTGPEVSLSLRLQEF